MGLIPVECFVVPVIFVMPEGSGMLGMVPVRPTPISRSALSDDAHSSDPGRWLTEVLARHLRGIEITSRIHPLLPRPMRGGRLAIPVWAMARAIPARMHGADPAALARMRGRASDLDLAHPLHALDRLGEELDDPGFGRQVMSAIRAALATDPFAQRVVGDEVRLSALSKDRLSDGEHPRAGLPAVVAILPESFTLGELQQAIAATLDLPPHAMESGSSFRRRIQEFVHRRVLRETTAAREPGEADRVGRPPRRYVFDPDAWRLWLNECGERGGSGSASEWERHSNTVADVASSQWTEDERRMAEVRALREKREMRESREMREMRSMARAPANRVAPTQYSRRPPAGEPGGGSEEAERIARLERMVEQLAREAEERKREG